MADIRVHNPNLRDIPVRRRGELPNSRGKSAQGDSHMASNIGENPSYRDNFA